MADLEQQSTAAEIRTDFVGVSSTETPRKKRAGGDDVWCCPTGGLRRKLKNWARAKEEGEPEADGDRRRIVRGPG